MVRRDVLGAVLLVVRVRLHSDVLHHPLHGIQLRTHHHHRRLLQEHHHHLLRNSNRRRLPVFCPKLCWSQYKRYRQVLGVFTHKSLFLFNLSKMIKKNTLLCRQFSLLDNDNKKECPEDRFKPISLKVKVPISFLLTTYVSRPYQDVFNHFNFNYI